MMKRIPLIALMLLAATAFALDVAVQSGWANYVWDRFTRGGHVRVAGSCFLLPSRWTVVPGSLGGTADVRRHFVADGPEAFASILPAPMVEGVRRAPATSSLIGGGFSMYDLGPASKGAPLRYVAVNDEWSIALTAAKRELLAELAQGLAACAK